MLSNASQLFPKLFTSKPMNSTEKKELNKEKYLFIMDNYKIIEDQWKKLVDYYNEEYELSQQQNEEQWREFETHMILCKILNGSINDYIRQSHSSLSNLNHQIEVYKQQCHESIEFEASQQQTDYQKIKLLQEILKEKQVEKDKQKLVVQQIEKTENLLNETSIETNNIINENQNDRIEIMRLQKHLQSIQQKEKEIDISKRIQNNLLQEAKGNIRVYCRIRPILETEYDSNIISVQGDSTVFLTVPQKYLKSDNNIKNYGFNFEYVFQESSNQDLVYNELSQLIENVIDGYNVCIFAYGQTGSGKTFTMQGLENFSDRGVIPRAVDHIFSEIHELEKVGWKLTVRVGFQEIYNETLKDLLSNQKADDIQMVEAEDQFVVSQLFAKAIYNRKVAETQCNEFSSRSHFIFQLNLSGVNSTLQIEKNQINATLNLIDLAGSERVNAAKTEGERFIETKCINKSLTSLSDVINALATKNSKLTHTLQKYLEGTSKTLMLVNISPKSEDFQMTMQSLRFAEKVKTCKVGQQQVPNKKLN